MKLLVVCSSLDVAAPLSATPAWWQLLKGLYEVGVDLVVTTYQGEAIGSPWWRVYPNPARLEGDLFMAAREIVRRVALRSSLTPTEVAPSGESRSQRAVRRLARGWIAPKWRRHLDRMLTRERDVDAVLLLNVPPNHLQGVAAGVRARHGVPVLFYDGDVPASLPHFRGFATGFRIYDGADLAEFDAVLCNSEAGVAALRDMGARAVYTLHYAADPHLYLPIEVTQDLDVFFYGHTTEYRAPWIRAMIAAPSMALPDLRFAVRGRRLGDVGRAEELLDVPFSRLRTLIARSRVNLAITRDTHAKARGSSTMRPFELAMMGACIVSNPCDGIEQWFEPDKEIIIVGSAEEAADRYRYLVSHDTERRAIGAAARRRALGEHTFRHRAQSLVRTIEAVA